MDEPTPPFDRADLTRLAVAVAFAAALHAVVVARTEVAARDSIGFVRYALKLDAAPNWPERLRVVRAAEQPPAYPVAVWAASYPARWLKGGVTPDSMASATQLASACAGVLLAVPLYFLGRRLFGRTAGLAAAVLFQSLPVAAQITSDGLTDSLYLLAVADALLLALRAVERPTPGRCLAFGLAAGFAYLTRPEGLLLTAVLAAVFLALPCLKRLAWRPAAGAAAAAVAGTLLAGGPYMALIGGVTNKPTGKTVLTGEGIEPFPRAAAAGPPFGVLLAEWRTRAEDARLGGVPWAVRSLSKETLKTANYAVAALAVVGVVLFRRRLREPGVWVPLGFAAANAAVLVLMASRIGYLSERHTLPIVMTGCLWAGGALVAVCGRLGRLDRPHAALALLAAAGLPSALKPMHANRAGHHAAGVWLAAHSDPATEEVFDPFCWAHYYAGRVMAGDDPKSPDPRPTVLFVWEQSNNPHSRLPMLEVARPFIPLSTPVYHWPEARPLEAASVVVYRYTRR